MRFEAPLEPGLTQELFDFWISIFGEPMDLPPEVFLGSEVEQNDNIVYVARREGRLAGTCGMTMSRRVPGLGGYGEVATDPALRRSGIASALCAQSVEDFRDRGGEALFLGTANPGAARIYHRLGWRKLAGANVMLNITSGDSPEVFLVDYFGSLGPAEVRPASPEIRIPIIPLLVMPHDWQVLDSNAAMFSTRYATQNSCMGLYRRYGDVAADGRGAWFAAVADDGKVAGISTARMDDSGGCRVDGFAHKSRMDAWADLLNAAIRWAETAGASAVTASVSVEDEEKRALFEGLGFLGMGCRQPFSLDGREVAAETLELGGPA